MKGASPQRDDRRLCAVVHAKFAENAVDVRLDGSCGDAQEIGDLPIMAPKSHLLQYLTLTVGEGLEQRIAFVRP